MASWPRAMERTSQVWGSEVVVAVEWVVVPESGRRGLVGVARGARGGGVRSEREKEEARASLAWEEVMLLS